MITINDYECDATITHRDRDIDVVVHYQHMRECDRDLLRIVAVIDGTGKNILHKLTLRQHDTVFGAASDDYYLKL